MVAIAIKSALVSKQWLGTEQVTSQCSSDVGDMNTNYVNRYGYWIIELSQ